MKFVTALILFQLVSVSLGFQSSKSLSVCSTQQQQKQKRKATFLSVLPPVEHFHDMHSGLAQLTQQQSFWLADAADAVADGAVKEGWWQSYINLFKLALQSIHDTVDGPLQANGITNSWGISIALFTASFRALLLPLSLQQTKSAEYLKALKPYQNEIKKKFKDNKEAQNRAIAKLFEDADQNPLAGCAISLAQLPVLLGLYRGIRNLAMDGNIDEPFLWIPSLQGPVTAATDFRGTAWLTDGWVDGVPALGWETTLAFLVMPCLLVLGQSLTMSVLQPPVDEDMPKEDREQLEKTQGVLKFLPLMIGYFSLQVPAGLTIYWFTTNLFTLASTVAARTYYKLNPPEIELPDYWENLDEMDTNDKRELAKAGVQVGPTFESMMEESKFHTIVERPQMRQSPAPPTMTIPPEMESWVASSTSASSETTTMERNTNTTLTTAEASA